MRLALLSDLHANLPALEACLAHARAQGADAFAFLGDLVGYGPEPAAVVERVRDLAGQGAIVLQGNHDLLAADGTGGPTLGEATAAWTCTRLNAGQREYLRELPLSAAVDGALLVHAAADAPQRWTYVTHPALAARSVAAAAAQGHHRVFGGHVHEQRVYYAGRHGGFMPFEPPPGTAVPMPAPRAWLATIGSVGQPRDGDPRAMYAVWEPAPRARLTFHRVAYPHLEVAAAVRRAGLPEAFAQRLEAGR